MYSECSVALRCVYLHVDRYLFCILIYAFFFFLMMRRPPRSTLFPTRRSSDLGMTLLAYAIYRVDPVFILGQDEHGIRSEEHTSELQSLRHLVCRLLLEKKKKGNLDRKQH